MELLTSFTPGRKRLMVLAPEINPSSFVFFYEKGSTGYSYSIRDYSTPHRVTERYAREFGCTADEIRQKASRVLDAPYLDTNRLADWHAYTAELNERYGLRSASTPAASTVRTVRPLNAPEPFPILNRAEFDRLPKASKSADLRRMLESPQSEDWVTWNLMTVLRTFRPKDWWEHLATCATKSNPHVSASWITGAPRLVFWPVVPSPMAYEVASRERMEQSRDAALIARSRDPRPVEGNSEIDIIIEDESALVYVEAKLNADISMRTTNDPARNQIARNIDCLLDAVADREPVFWMFVRDATSGRAYAQLMDEYRRKPETLWRDLPHREFSVIQKVARNLAIVTWRDIGTALCAPALHEETLIREVKQELLRRI